MRILTWPNVLSLTRIPLAIVFLLLDQRAARVAIVLLAWLSDVLDGRVARKLGIENRGGEIVDAITDKLFVLILFAGFLAQGRLELWHLPLLLARDVFNSTLFAYAKLRGIQVRFQARWSGKVVTFLQVVVLIALLLAPWSLDMLVLLTGSAGAVAIADYSRVGMRALRAGASAN